jgi:tetratricopeptide (TPR) repeat protein
VRVPVCAALLALPGILSAQAPATPAPAAAPAVDMSDPEKMGKTADEAWSKGEWAVAAANYAGLLEIAKKTGAKIEKLEPLYFILGAAYFNVPDHAKAEAIFNEYVTTYPKGQNVYQANLALARILKAQKKWADAIKRYEPLKGGSAVFKDDVNIELAECYKENQQVDKAMVLFETALAPGIRTSGEVRQALKLVELYQDTKPEKGVALLERVKRANGARPLVNEINFAALKLADELMNDKKEEQALQAYQNLRKKDEVLATLKDVAAEYDRTVTRLSALVAAKTGDSVAASARMDQARLFAAQTKAQIEQLSKEQNYDAIVFFRISRCFAQLGRFWEARLGFQWLYENFKDFEDRPVVLYLLIYSNAKLAPSTPDQDGMKLIARTEELCREYLKAYSSGAQVTEVAELLIAQVQKSKNPEKINAVYDEVMKYLDNSPNKAAFLATQVQNYLEQYDFIKAREAAEKFRAAAPGDPLMEDIDFMYALTFFFQNDAEGSIRELAAYRDKYPNGKYLADTRYRLANIFKGEELGKKRKGKSSSFMRVIEECQDIINTYPGTPTVADCYALIGDCYKEMSGEEMAEKKLTGEELDKRTADAFVEAVRRGQTDNVVEYSLSQARPLLQSQGRWKDIEDLYREFLDKNPDHRMAMESIGWIAKSIVRQGTTPEEREKNQARAREFMAETILANINNPQKEGVEDLLQQLAISSVPKPKRIPVDPNADPKAPKPAPPTVAENFAAAEAEMNRLLGIDSGKLSVIGQARLLYVKAELYKYLEGRVRPTKAADGTLVVDTSPKQSEVLMEKLVTEFKPDDFSPRLLAVVGEYFVQRGAEERASACFNRLIQFFPQSPFMDWALVGLGQMSYNSKDFETAQKRFTQAVEEYPGAKYPEAQIGLARVLFETGKLDESEKMLKDMFGDKSVSKEVKAEVTWLLGEIRYKQKNLSDAFNYFQQIYLRFKAFPKWVARGYLRAGEVKEEMGKMTDAVDVYRDAVNDPRTAEKLKSEPDFQKVKDRLRRLGN